MATTHHANNKLRQMALFPTTLHGCMCVFQNITFETCSRHCYPLCILHAVTDSILADTTHVYRYNTWICLTTSSAALCQMLGAAWHARYWCDKRCLAAQFMDGCSCDYILQGLVLSNNGLTGPIPFSWVEALERCTYDYDAWYYLVWRTAAHWNEWTMHKCGSILRLNVWHEIAACLQAALVYGNKVTGLPAIAPQLAAAPLLAAAPQSTAKPRLGAGP